jgi:GntR family transcriptional regulator
VNLTAPDDAAAGAAPPPLLAPGPLYKQVKAELIRSLSNGEWKPGQMLPSEAKLAARYGVGVSTIRAAIGHLVAANVLFRRQGKGTFVSLHGGQRSIYQFFHVVRDDGVRQLPVSELLSFRKSRADGRTADLLRLPRTARGLDVYRMRNVLKVAGVPVVLSDITLPCALAPGLDEAVIRQGGDTLYAVYQKRFGIHIVRTVEKLRAARPDAAAARSFGLSGDEPLLQVERLAYTFNNVPVEVRLSRVDTRNHHYLLDRGDAQG